MYRKKCLHLLLLVLYEVLFQKGVQFEPNKCRQNAVYTVYFAVYMSTLIYNVNAYRNIEVRILHNSFRTSKHPCRTRNYETCVKFPKNMDRRHLLVLNNKVKISCVDQSGKAMLRKELDCHSLFSPLNRNRLSRDCPKVSFPTFSTLLFLLATMEAFCEIFEMSGRFTMKGILAREVIKIFTARLQLLETTIK